MGIPAGTRIGSCEIVSSLGAGGMGEVYRARDTRLGREVAIKVLPDMYAQDGDRLSRFTREAQVLAESGVRELLLVPARRWPPRDNVSVFPRKPD